MSYPTAWPCRDCGQTIHAGKIHRCRPGKLDPARREVPSVQAAADKAERSVLDLFLARR